MLIDIDGEKKEVPFSAVDKESLGSDADYNAEVDRIAAKRTNIFETQYKAQHEATLSQLKADHLAELDSTKKLTSGKASEQMQALIDANEQLSGNFNQLKADLATEKENGIKAGLKAELAAALASVPDELVRNTLIESGMKSAVIGEDGQPHFNIGDGVMGGSKELASQFETQYPHHFKSNQPGGAGLKGGAADLPAGATDEQRRIHRINEKFK